MQFWFVISYIGQLSGGGKLYELLDESEFCLLNEKTKSFQHDCSIEIKKTKNESRTKIKLTASVPPILRTAILADTYSYLPGPPFQSWYLKISETSGNKQGHG